MGDRAPASLKSIQPFLTIAQQFMKRDPAVAYYAAMYAVQEGIRVGKDDPEAKAYLIQRMDQLQKMKKSLKGEEAMESDVVAQAHIENAALKLFEFADNEDRAACFHKNMIKAFFTASQIFTVLRQFGELPEEIEDKLKYAKWKAVEIDRCLKSGITPTPGPPGGEDTNEEGQPPPLGFSAIPSDDTPWVPPGAQQVLPPKPVPRPRQNPPVPQGPPGLTPAAYQPVVDAPPPQGFQPGPENITRAQKLCKFASSALEYEDVQGAVEYLGKAMNLLKTGREA